MPEGNGKQWRSPVPPAAAPRALSPARTEDDQVQRELGNLRNVPLLPKGIENERMGWRAYLSLCLLAVAGVALSISAGIGERDKEDKRILQEFRQLAGDRVSVIETTMHIRSQDILNLGSLFAASNAVNREEFHEFVRPLLAQRAGPAAMMWVPRIENRERAIHVVQAREDGIAEFEFRNLNAPGGPVVVGESDVYFPIYFIEPLAHNMKLLGHDYGQDLTQLGPMFKACDERTVIASPKYKLEIWQKEGSGVGFYMALPVFSKASPLGSIKQRRDNLEGFVVGVYDLRTTIQSAVNTLGRADIDIEVADVDGDPGDQLLYYYNSERPNATELFQPRSESELLSWDYAYRFKVGDRVWNVRCRPLNVFLGDRRTSVAANTLGGGLSLTLILSAYVWTILRRKVQSQHQAKLLWISQRRFAGILNSADDAIVSVDDEGSILLFNRGAERIFGRLADDVLGRPLAETLALSVVNGADREPFDLKIDRDGPAPGQRRQIVGRREDGTEFPAEVSISHIDIEGGSIRTVILRDVSERHRLETQLLHAQKMEAVGQLTGGVAHDFNNLLQVINGYTAMALRQIDPRCELGEMLDEVRNAGDKAVTLTRQLLAFSRRQVLQPRDINLNQLIEEMAKMLRRMIGDDIDFIFHPNDKSGSVRADPGQLEQVLLNLAVNARDAMAGGGQLLVSTDAVFLDAAFVSRHPWAHTGHFVLMSVSDSGCGMDEETQSHIFEPFFTTKMEGKGTGLGLATTYGIVKQHGGYIHVYSELGRGTTFRIYLPAVDHAIDEIEVREVFQPLNGDETILVAEDSESVRELVKHVLEEAGYTAIGAVDGEEAVRMFTDRQIQIDLVLLDMMMPNMNGSAAYERIREIDPRVPVVFTSGYTAGSVQTEFFKRNNLRLVSKPYDPRELLAAVRQELDRTRERQA
jgi:PAS domain S-box-containing protein